MLQSVAFSTNFWYLALIQTVQSLWSPKAIFFLKKANISLHIPKTRSQKTDSIYDSVASNLHWLFTCRGFIMSSTYNFAILILLMSSN